MKKTNLLLCVLAVASMTMAQPLKLSKVSAARQRVWTEWQQRMNRHVRTNTPAQDMTDAWFYTWTLPADLEPNAEWNYYWGRCGSSLAEGEQTAPQPMVLYLHGSGPREQEWKTGYKLAHHFGKELAGYYCVPQIPQEGQWYRWYQRSKQWAYERLLRLALASGQVDPDRIYMIGISEGGYGSQRLASFYADYLAGAGPMAGGEPLKNAPAENCGQIGFSLLTGAQDRGFYRDELTYWTQQAFDSLQARYPDRYIHRVNLIPGRGHFINYDLTLRWLKHFRRTAQPHRFMWEDFEMDGRHREGFYNLQVLERSKGYRQMYRMDIEGQTVRLTVDDVAYQTIQTDSVWGIEMRFARQFTPSASGRLRLYLSEELVDLNRPVSIVLNGVEVFHGKVKCDERWLRESLRLFCDPRRLFPAAVELEVKP